MNGIFSKSSILSLIDGRIFFLLGDFNVLKFLYSDIAIKISTKGQNLKIGSEVKGGKNIWNFFFNGDSLDAPERHIWTHDTSNTTYLK